MKKLLSLCCIWLLALTCFGYEKMELGQPTPQWQILDYQSNPISAGVLKGRVIVLNIFTTTCVPALWEVPEFQKMQVDYGTNKVFFVGVALNEGTNVLSEFVKDFGLTYCICPSTELFLYQCFYFNPMQGLPMTIIIDERGIVHCWFKNYKTPTFYREKINEVLDKYPSNLKIRSAGKKIELTWKDSPVILEVSNDLKNWLEVASQITTENGTNTLVVPKEGRFFYRLRK